MIPRIVRRFRRRRLASPIQRPTTHAGKATSKPMGAAFDADLLRSQRERIVLRHAVGNLCCGSGFVPRNPSQSCRRVFLGGATGNRSAVHCLRRTTNPVARRHSSDRHLPGETHLRKTASRGSTCIGDRSAGVPPAAFLSIARKRSESGRDASAPEAAFLDIGRRSGHMPPLPRPPARPAGRWTHDG